MATKMRVPVETFLAMPEGEAPYHEYIDGEVIRKAMPDAAHPALVDEFAYAIGTYRRRFGGKSSPEGRVQFHAGNDRTDYRLPDYAFWARGRPYTVAVGDRIFLQPPTLAIEVRSPDDAMREQRARCRFYRSAGVDVCWLVDPLSRTVEVFDAGRDGAVLQANDALELSAMPDLIELADLFAVLDSLDPPDPA